MKSKRLAFRYKGYLHPVHYKTDYEDGEALLTNISTDGCAVENADLSVEPGERLLVSIALGNKEERFEARGVVVWVDGDHFAVKFMVVEHEAKKSVRTFFSKRFRKQAHTEES